jgi:hypothetical protein
MRPAHLLLALAAVAALSAPARAHANPALPAGWIAGGPAAPVPPAAPPGAKSRRALQLAARPPRTALTPVPVALADLDLVEIERAPTDAEVTASNEDPPGDPPDELFVDRGCARASVSGHAVGHIQVGWLGEPIAPRSGGGVMLYGVRGQHGGGDGKHLYALATLETVDPLPDGTLRFTETTARFNVRTCKAHTATRFTAIARPILDGRAFLFRTRCPSCEKGGRDELHAVVPSSDFGVEAYQHHALRLEPGRGGGLAMRVDAYHARQFAEAFGRTAPALPRGFLGLVGIEAVQGLGEASPTVIAYAALVPEAP